VIIGKVIESRRNQMKEEQNEKTPEQLFEEVLIDRNGLSLMDLLVHPDLKTFVDNFEDNK
jgi:hypothetical protein